MSGRRRWWLIAGTGVLALIQAGAVLHFLQLPPDLAARTSLLLPLEVLLSGLWALIFTMVAINLVGNPLRPRLIWAYPAFVTYSALRLFIFVQADYDRNRGPFVILATLLSWAVFFALRQRRPMME
jgi:hypothetical protein